jgi:hypothetical protein
MQVLFDAILITIVGVAFIVPLSAIVFCAIKKLNK